MATRGRLPAGEVHQQPRQAYEIDESMLTAKPGYNFDVGTYSLALGSAQQLVSGNFYFDL